jgi:hypothetical protein
VIFQAPLGVSVAASLDLSPGMLGAAIVFPQS